MIRTVLSVVLLYFAINLIASVIFLSQKNVNVEIIVGDDPKMPVPFWCYLRILWSAMTKGLLYILYFYAS